MELDKFVVTYQIPPELSERLAADFMDVARIPVPVLTLVGENTTEAQKSRHKQDSFDRALGQYCSNELAAVFETPQGKELHGKLMQVMTGESDGLLLKGLPTDVPTKALIVHGIKNLLANNEEDFSESRSPQLLVRKAVDKPAFHRDAERYIIQHSNNSFMLMASAQENPFAAPTLFRKVYSKDKDFASHSLASDEILLFNNKNLEHSAGLKTEDNQGVPRNLMRLVVIESFSSYPLKHLKHVNHVRDKAHIPSEQDALKHWLLQEGGRLAGAQAGRG